MFRNYSRFWSACTFVGVAYASYAAAMQSGLFALFKGIVHSTGEVKYEDQLGFLVSSLVSSRP
jgi:hypothetical protein